MSSQWLLIENKQKLKKFQNGTLLEIGSERGFGSTSELAILSEEVGMNFISVDIDPEISAGAKKMLIERDLPGTICCECGEDFLKCRQDPIHVVYLDAFDCWHNHHPQERIDAYKSRNTSITNENCWEMHLECCKELVRLMPKDGLVCFDDIFNEEWDGKGKLAIPYLLENRFKLLKYEKIGVLLIKE